MTKISLPKSLLDLSDEDRDGIIAVLLEAAHLPKEKILPHRMAGDEHNIWERNGDELLADAEDELYRELAENEFMRMLDLVEYLGLPLEDDITKSFEPEFHTFEDVLIKAKGSGRTKMSDFIKYTAAKAKQKARELLVWMTDGKAFSKAQMKHIEELLVKNLPNYAKRAEDYTIRAGFIGKIRGEAEQKGFETLGAILDRVPQSITVGERKGVVLTLREKEKAEARGETVEIMPLTPLEAEAVKHASMHAGDKMTEISAKHTAGVRQLVMQAKKERWSAQKLAQALFDKFGDHNRDWRRVAITELAFAANDAYLSGCADGDELYSPTMVGACKHCQSLLEGKTFKFLKEPPAKLNYDIEEHYIWVGKTNYGRKVAAWIPAAPLHPNCRHRWHRISRFYKMVDGKLIAKDTAELINEERAKRGLAPDPNVKTSLEELTKQFLSKVNQG